MPPLYVIGDVHGCAEELRELLSLLPITRDTTVVFVGDYVDRGPLSSDVIAAVLELEERCQVVPLIGNHEAMFIDFLEAPRSPAAGLFIYNGGSATLASYADDRGEFTIPPAHRDFLARLRLTYQTNDYFFVHAGVPDIPLEELDAEKYRKYLLWVRAPFHNSKHRWSKLIVHGHSPVREVEIRPTRINVDTGCVYDRTLTALSLPDGRIYSVQRRRVDGPLHLRDQQSNRVAVRFKGAVPVNIDFHGRVVRFETLDYSEFGMLMRDLSGSSVRLLSVGEPVTGTIAPEGHQPVRFHGRVLRVQNTFEGTTYAVQIHQLDRDPR